MDHLLDPWYGWVPLRIKTALTPLTVALRGTELVEFSDIWTWHKKSCRKSLQCQALKCWVLQADDQLIMRCRLYLLEEIFPLGRKIPLGSFSESSLGRLHCSYKYISPIWAAVGSALPCCMPDRVLWHHSSPAVGTNRRSCSAAAGKGIPAAQSSPATRHWAHWSRECCHFKVKCTIWRYCVGEPFLCSQGVCLIAI